MREVIPDARNQVPMRADVRVVEEADGKISVYRRRWGPVRRLVARMLRVRPELAIHLDSLGSAAWRLIDGQRTVGEIRNALARQFPDQTDVGIRLGKFLSAMISNRMLRLW